MSHWITHQLLPILAGTILIKEGEREMRNWKQKGVEGKIAEDRGAGVEEERRRYTELWNYRSAMNKALRNTNT